ncbi:hypothetical protein [Sphingomonas sp.]|uniref:hypothetical protein n=1 Tax=Sphingomonas sp. TaxID=28214 RepID=UPI0038A298C3
MKRLLALPLVLATIAATAPAPKVEVATGDWSELPDLQSRGYDHLQSNVMQRIWELGHARTCQIPGYAMGKLDFRISFATQFNPDGSIARLIVPQLNCPEAEGIVAGALLEMIHGGDYRRHGDSPEGWYKGNLTFGFEGGPGS